MKQNKATKFQAPRGRRMKEEKFVLAAINGLKEDGRRGIHTVFSGFNAAFRSYYGGADPVAATGRLAKKGVIALRLSRGGAMIYRAEDAPPSLKERRKTVEEALRVILG